MSYKSFLETQRVLFQWIENITLTFRAYSREDIILFHESLWYHLPVHDVPEVFDILCSGIAIVNVVCMFPDITREKWYVFGGDGSFSVWSGYDIERSIGFHDEPCPSWAECLDRFFWKCFLKILECPPFLLYRFEEFFVGFWFFSWEWIKIESMIPYLSGVIENRTFWGFYDNVFESHGCIFCTGNESIECVDIGLVVFPRVVLECLLWEKRRECVESIGKRWFREHRKNYGKAESVYTLSRFLKLRFVWKKINVWRRRCTALFSLRHFSF